MTRSHLRFAAALAACLVIVTGVCGQDNKAVIKEIKTHRKTQKKGFLDPSKSPLPREEIKSFRGLHYFEIDLNFRVTAKFVRTENTPLFLMKTTTDRLPQYRKFGEVHFEIEDTPIVLEVYQSPEVSLRPGYEDYLFIPFTDQTNGMETYEVGRYIDLRIPASDEVDEVVIDFNLAYNPYCAYNDRYSCPVPPAVNHIGMRIEAGEKKYRVAY